MFVCLSGCVYNPPEGYTENHHTYEAISAFASSIDPQAIVSEEYTDMVDEYGWKYREWDAVIHGVSCHVSSVSDRVWNEGIGAGEFAKVFYRIDTDYDYVIMQKALAEKKWDWKTSESIRSRYHIDTIFVELDLPEYRMLSDDELEELWQEMIGINDEFRTCSLGRKAVFSVPAPGKYWSQSEDEYYVRKEAYTYTDELTEQGKSSFIQEYHDRWALLESELPIMD